MTQGQAKMVASVAYAPELSTLSYLSRSLHCHSSVAQGYLPTIQPNLGLPRTRPQLISAILYLLINSRIDKFQDYTQA